MASLSLGFLSNFINHSLNWMLALMSVPVVQGFVSHEFAQESGISSEPREHHTHMIINIIYFFLMGSQIIWSHFQSNKAL